MLINFDNIVQGLRNCSGRSEWFVEDFVSRRLAIDFTAVTTRAPTPFALPELKAVSFAEAQHFVSRAIYHLAVGKRLIATGAPTWGLISFYYSSFFSAHAALRLRGTTFLKLSRDARSSAASTYKLEAVNLVSDRFQIRKASERSGSEHKRIWAAFYESFSSIANRSGYAELVPILCISDPETRLAEMHRRHLLNYFPGHGYYEFGSQKALRAIVKNLQQDVFGRIGDALADDDGQLEAGALLRLRLCCGILREIAADEGVYSLSHTDLVRQRSAMLATLGCPQGLRSHLESVF